MANRNYNRDYRNEDNPQGYQNRDYPRYYYDPYYDPYWEEPYDYWDYYDYYYNNPNYNENRNWSNQNTRNRNRNRRPSRTQNRNWNQGYNTNDWDTDFYDSDWNTPGYTYYEYWYVPGPYEGYGPAGYQRSDERIQDDIYDRLTRHGQIDARNMHVDVNGGEVTLTGTANTRQEKRMAEDIADGVLGVVDINNQLRVTNKNRMGRGGHQQKQIDCGQIQTGMEVVGSRGKHVGTVKEIRDNDFLVDRDAARDIYVPFSACQDIDDRLHLNVTADQVDKQGWPMPQVVGSR